MNGVLASVGPEALLAAVLAASLRFHFLRVWMLSGAAGFTYMLLSGERQGNRILPQFPISLLLLALNLTCAAASTSWFFYWIFLASCWPSMAVAAIYQFSAVADFVRARLRGLLHHLHFTADKIALFEIPALEIDVDVAGLMVIRGLTLSISSLTLVAHGIEVGIKLSDDMELALQVDKVTVALFRHIEVGDVFGNVKGGEYEMTFGKLNEDSRDEHGDALMDEDTPLLKAASSWSSQDAENWKAPEKIRMTEKMTDGNAPEPATPTTGAHLINRMTADDDEAALEFHRRVEEIEKTDEINIARRTVNRQILERQDNPNTNIDIRNVKHIRAAICSELHDKPSIQHPPKASIKVTTLRNISSPGTRRFLHRLPMLLRLLLNPIAYFHPVKISSITVAASGRWLQFLLGTKVFADYGQGNDIRKLRERIFDWLRGSNFAFQLADVVATAQVPFNTDYDISARLVLDDIVAYRTLPREIHLREVMRLGGADATIIVPSYLLPHHEHLLPSKEQLRAESERLRRVIKETESGPKATQAENALKAKERDETFMKVSAHARLPVQFDQELLNFVAALVKATKIIEFEKEGDSVSMDQEVHGFKEFSKVLGGNIKSSLKQAATNAAANDRWIAKLVGKVTKKMEKMQGDVGYSGNVPVGLKWYRDNAETASKILP